MIALGLEQDQAQVLANRVADWRDDDDLVRAHGAETPDYAAARLPAPANRPFAVETELARVMGFTPQLVQCVTPFVTTYSGASDIDPQAAPEFLRLAFALRPQLGAQRRGATGRLRNHRRDHGGGRRPGGARRYRATAASRLHHGIRR